MEKKAAYSTNLHFTPTTTRQYKFHNKKGYESSDKYKNILWIWQRKPQTRLSLRATTYNTCYCWAHLMLHMIKVESYEDTERLSFVWKTWKFRGEFKWNGSSR